MPESNIIVDQKTKLFLILFVIFFLLVSTNSILEWKETRSGLFVLSMIQQKLENVSDYQVPKSRLHNCLQIHLELNEPFYKAFDPRIQIALSMNLKLSEVQVFSETDVHVTSELCDLIEEKNEDFQVFQCHSIFPDVGKRQSNNGKGFYRVQKKNHCDEQPAKLISPNPKLDSLIRCFYGPEFFHFRIVGPVIKASYLSIYRGECTYDFPYYFELPGNYSVRLALILDKYGGIKEVDRDDDLIQFRKEIIQTFLQFVPEDKKTNAKNEILISIQNDDLVSNGECKIGTNDVTKGRWLWTNQSTSTPRFNLPEDIGTLENLSLLPSELACHYRETYDKVMNGTWTDSSSPIQESSFSWKSNNCDFKMMPLHNCFSGKHIVFTGDSHSNRRVMLILDDYYNTNSLSRASVNILQSQEVADRFFENKTQNPLTFSLVNNSFTKVTTFSVKERTMFISFILNQHGTNMTLPEETDVIFANFGAWPTGTVENNNGRWLYHEYYNQLNMYFQYLDNIKKNRLKQLSKNLTIIWIHSFPCEATRNREWRTNVRATIFNRMAEMLASKLNITFVDLYTPSEAMLFTPDGFHFQRFLLSLHQWLMELATCPNKL